MSSSVSLILVYYLKSEQRKFGLNLKNTLSTPCLVVCGFYAQPVLCFKILTGDLYFDSLIIGPFRFVYLLVRLSEKEVNGLPKTAVYGDLGQKETAWCLVIVVIYTKWGEVKVVIWGRQTTKGEGAFSMGLLTPLDTMVRCPGQLVYEATVTCIRVRQIIVTIYMKGLQSTS